jgi:signal transduction histidine kinase
VLLDEGLHVVLANRAASALFRVDSTRLRGVPITKLIPHGNLEPMLRDFGGRRTKVIETCVPNAGRGGGPLTLKMNAVRLAQWAPMAAVRRAAEPAVAKREFRLLVLEDISDKAMLEQQVVDAEKQAAMGQLAAGILHEVANPLSGIGSNLMFVRSALSGGAPDSVTRALDSSLDQLDEMRQLLGTLSGFPGRTAPRFELADLHDIVRRSLTFVEKDAERRRIRLAVSFAMPSMACEMDVRLMRQVLLNLLKNAMEAMPNGGRLDVRTFYRAGQERQPASVGIEIADTGVGIADADLRRVFRPLFSTKPRGAGLGLSFCRQAVEEHGGEIRLASRGKGYGTVAQISLPVRQAVIDYN